MPKDAKRIIHLFLNEKAIEGTDQEPYRVLMQGWGNGESFTDDSKIISGYYHGNERTLCGQRAHCLNAFTSRKLKDVPLQEGERFCKNCAKHEDFGLRMLSQL